MRSPSGRLPMGVYRKYKRSTAQFLRWLERAHGAGVGATPRGAVKLDLYDQIVRAIAREPTALPPSLLRHWPRALAACESAITLRAHSAQYFPTEGESAASHAHFLQRLRTWFTTLDNTTRPVVDGVDTSVEDQAIDFSNYYEVLALPDDYFPEEDDALWAELPTIGQPLTEAERKRLFDDAFTEDLNAELACLFMELEELAEAVYEAYFAVKQQTKTLVEATAVAKIAIDSAASVIAKLQLRYPSIRTAQDLMSMIQTRVSERALGKQLQTVLKAWYPSKEKGPATYRYVPGTMLVDTLWVARALLSFVTAIPADPNTKLVIRDGFFGHTYSEEDTPHYTAPDMTTMPSFLSQQLPLLFNVLLANRASSIANDTSSFTGWFLDQFERFFTTRTVSVHLVFVCICWVRSVAALQGDAGLGRNVSLTIMHRWDIEKRLGDSIAKGEIRRADKSLHKEMEEALGNMQQSEKAQALLRANPLLAGLMLLDHHFRFLHLGTESTLVTSRFRAFCHVYSALRDRELLESIPFFEDALRVYERAVFTPSRDAATQGSFFRTYLVSSHLTDATVDAMLHRRPPPPERYKTRVREYFHLNDLSRVFKLLKENDYSVLPVEATNASWKSLLKSVSDLATEELFETRVLSRDMLRLSDDLTDLFETICDVMGRRADADRIIEEGFPGQTAQYAINRALEDVVVIPLLPLLDCLNRDGTSRLTPDTSDLLQMESVRRVIGSAVGAEIILSYSRRVADVISRCFIQRAPVNIEAKYFSFPPTPNWSSLEFGDVSIHSEAQLKSTHEMFIHLLEMMEESEGPLQREEVEKLKRLVIVDPGILAFATMDELCTLYHHAAAGPARDRRLVEWMHQMGALHFQPKHCRHRPAPGQLSSIGMATSQLCNALAVHCAAKRGYTDMVRFLLEADNLRDLNTVTYHTKESLAHLAVKNGHRELYDLLDALGADMRHKDASGMHVYDLTSDASWKRKILKLADLQRGQDAKLRRHRDRGPELRREGEEATAHLLRQLELQRDVERAERVAKQSSSTRRRFGHNRPRVTPSEASTSAASSSTAASPSSEPATTNGVNSKKKKKNKKKKAVSGQPTMAAETTVASTSASPSPATLATSLLQQLLVSGEQTAEPDAERNVGNDATVDRAEKLASLLDALKEGNTATEPEHNACADAAIAIIDNLSTVVKLYVTSNTLLNKTPAMKRDALDASRAVFLLSKYQRQLPESPLLPHAMLWKRGAQPKPTSPIEKLQRLAGSPLDFTQFLALAVYTAQVLGACDRIPQAKELLDLVERRLLKFKQRSPLFREYVQFYLDGRQRAGIDSATDPLTPEGERHFEWYASDNGVNDAMTLIQLDMLHGYKWYVRFKCIEGFSSPEFARFITAIDAKKTTDNDCVCIDGYVAAGAESTDKMYAVLAFIREAAEASGLHFSSPDAQSTTKKLELCEFEFSATGIVRKA